MGGEERDTDERVGLELARFAHEDAPARHLARVRLRDRVRRRACGSADITLYEPLTLTLTLTLMLT